MATPSYKNSSYFQGRRLRGAKAHEFSIVSEYKNGYRSREDITTLPAGVLVQGSQNVVTNVFGRVGVVQGFTLDGTGSTVLAPILASYDYEMHTGTIRHLRAGFLTSAGNDGKLQYRYVDSSNIVTYKDLLTSLASVSFNFTDYWDTTHEQSLVLFVNGLTGTNAGIYEWTGGVTTIASVTMNTITKSGSTSWAEEGFYTTGSHKVTINGTVYTATGGWATTTLTGVTPDPTGVVMAGDIAVQTPEFTKNSDMTSLPLNADCIIGSLRNQVYVADFKNRSVYISKQNNYKDYAFTSPVRVVGEGALVTLDGNPVAFVPQEDRMYVSAGTSQWYQTEFILSSDLTKEAFQINRLKTTTQQATQSQALTAKMKNNVVFVSNEPILESLGRVANVVLTPQMTDLSYSIINDMNSYDFTDGSVFYWKNFIFIAVPKHSLIRIYNQTNPKDEYWEAPVGYPISRFSIIEDGSLVGHSYQTSESYKLFTGYNFNGNVIDARAVFSFQNHGTASASKSLDAFYFDGYISGNATLNMGIKYDLDGCATMVSGSISGVDTQFVCVGTDDNSLGKNNLGAAPLGGDIATETATSLPPKFRAILTFPRTPFYEDQYSFSSVGIDYNWQINRFGSNATPTSEGSNDITR